MPRPTLRKVFGALLTMANDAITAKFAQRKRILYDSAGQSIRGTIYYTEAQGQTRAVLLLHTAGGLTPHEHAMAARLAKEGYTTLVITYSKRTNGTVLEDDQMPKQLEQITLDGLRFLQADPSVDPNRAAVIGLSLGGYFATNIAAIREMGPRAVVIYYGVYALAESKVATLWVWSGRLHCGILL